MPRRPLLAFLPLLGLSLSGTKLSAQCESLTDPGNDQSSSAVTPEGDGLISQASVCVWAVQVTPDGLTGASQPPNTSARTVVFTVHQGSGVLLLPGA